VATTTPRSGCTPSSGGSSPGTTRPPSESPSSSSSFACDLRFSAWLFWHLLVVLDAASCLGLCWLIIWFV
jgi:hypothetical protein